MNHGLYGPLKTTRFRMAPIITYSILSRTIDLLRARETPLYYSLLENYMILINYMSKNII